MTGYMVKRTGRFFQFFPRILNFLNLTLFSRVINLLLSDDLVVDSLLGS